MSALKLSLVLLCMVVCNSCSRNLKVGASLNGEKVLFSFQRTILGFPLSIDIGCLDTLSVTRLRDRLPMWFFERDGKSCYSGRNILYGLNVNGYSGRALPLNLREKYVVTVSGSAGDGEIVIGGLNRNVVVRVGDYGGR